MVKKLFTLLSLTAILAAGQAFAGVNYMLDGIHSTAAFSVKHLVISNTKGNFQDISGMFEVDEKDITNSKVTFSMKTASVTTGNEKRDNHLRSADFLDAEKYPTISFTSSKIEKKGEDYIITGKLTIKDVTREISFPFAFNGFAMGPMGHKRFGAEAALTINRQDFNVKWNKAVDGGGFVVGNDVKIELQLEGMKAGEMKASEMKGTN